MIGFYHRAHCWGRNRGVRRQRRPLARAGESGSRAAELLAEQVTASPPGEAGRRGGAVQAGVRSTRQVWKQPSPSRARFPCCVKPLAEIRLTTVTGPVLRPSVCGVVPQNLDACSPQGKNVPRWVPRAHHAAHHRDNGPAR